MNRSNQGFTLMEVIGVMAVIAIIAAIATPRIFAAIQDAQVTSLVQQANDLRANVAAFYKDTGVWPRHIPSSDNARNRQLTNNVGSNGQPIPGWDGPYLEKEMSNPITSGAYVDLLVTNAASHACDLDGDGNLDGRFVVLRVDQVDETIARKASNVMDQDSHIETGDEAWQAAGRVKRLNGNHAHSLIFCLARV